MLVRCYQHGLLMQAGSGAKQAAMILTIDCGNTNTVFALFDGAGFPSVWRMATDSRRTADDLAVWLSQLMQHPQLCNAGIEGVVISCVVPDCLRSLCQLAEKHFGCTPVVIESGNPDLGIEIRIDRPSQAGADRLANTAAAAAYYTVPALVVDFGTATTFDVIDADGAYCGGAIAPGVNLSIEALYRAAARLPLIDTTSWHPAMPVIGGDTVDAMNAGLYFGYISLVEGMVRRIAGSMQQQMTVIATGGLAVVFAPALDCVDVVDTDLTLKGMIAVYNKTRMKA